MDINSNEVAYKRKVGTLEGAPIIEVALRGGLHLHFVLRNKRPEVLSSGPHPAVSRFIAKKKEPKIEWTLLSKSDHIEPEHFAFCLPEYEKLTDDLRKRQGLK